MFDKKPVSSCPFETGDLLFLGDVLAHCLLVSVAFSWTKKEIALTFTANSVSCVFHFKRIMSLYNMRNSENVFMNEVM